MAGKIKKGMTAPPEGSRIAWQTQRLLEEKKFKKSITCTSWGEFENNQMVWDTVEAVEEIAKAHGNTLRIYSLP